MAAPAQVPARARARVGGRGTPLAKRTPTVATRRHNLAGPRTMVRATVNIQASTRPTLALVPRRRRAARFVVLVGVSVALAMLGAAAFQTQIAQRQLSLDELDQSIVDARTQYDALRRERSELRSPERLATIAAAAGMAPSRDTQFGEIDPTVVIAVQQSTGVLPQVERPYGEGLLDQYRQVKSLGEATP
jgi:cell division protein FtsL